ncbi:MAG: 16S rRNA (cytosine(1402)-N(4))-methyltransferase [Acidimicrobiales bacterium]
MRSPSTGSMEVSSSAHFHLRRWNTPPNGISPVEGLRMCPAYAHTSVMTAEVVELFSTVPAGVVVDATLGGAGHAIAILTTHPHLQVIGLESPPPRHWHPSGLGPWCADLDSTRWRRSSGTWAWVS